MAAKKPIILAGALAALAFSCERRDDNNPLVVRGRTVYQTTCIACHNADPKKPGVLGPEVAGSSAELIEARVMRAEYPAGYTPKRPSKQMLPLPQLKEDLPALRAYLNSVN